MRRFTRTSFASRFSETCQSAPALYSSWSLLGQTGTRLGTLMASLFTKRPLAHSPPPHSCSGCGPLVIGGSRRPRTSRVHVRKQLVLGVARGSRHMSLVLRCHTYFYRCRSRTASRGTASCVMQSPTRPKRRCVGEWTTRRKQS